MTLPVNAQIGAAPNFTSNLEGATTFFVAQDAASASGRPARFLNGHSAQAQLRTASVLQLATQVGLPSLREYVVAQHVVLYAHSDSEVVLLALTHHRHLAYSAAR